MFLEADAMRQFPCVGMEQIQNDGAVESGESSWPDV
jgi:hypothetical protein